MIPKLRRKFISITAVALFIMILLVMLAINGVFIIQNNQALDTRLQLIMGENLPGDTPSTPGSHSDFDVYSEPNHTQPTDKKPQENMDFFPMLNENLRIESDGCLVYLNADGSIREIIQHNSEKYSESNMQSIISAIYQSGETDGWHQYYKFRVETHKDSTPNPTTVIGLLNASASLYSILSMALISCVIGILSYILVLVVIIFASGRAVKPIAESYARQKQFVTNAGHELKTPLTVISANNELSRMLYGDSEWFDSIDTQVSKMNNLVRNLITLAKMDEEVTPVFTTFNFSDAVYDTAKSFENLIHSTGRIITFDIADDITYIGDESKIRQVVSILMDNAVKYCDEKGKIAVKLSEGKQIHLQVINDFSTADDCDFSQVFERFYRADKARTPDGSYGLGLSIAKSMVELHKGEINARILEHNRVAFEVLLSKNPRATK